MTGPAVDEESGRRAYGEAFALTEIPSQLRPVAKGLELGVDDRHVEASSLRVLAEDPFIEASSRVEQVVKGPELALVHGRKAHQRGDHRVGVTLDRVGFVDEAQLALVLGLELRHEIDAYEDFCEFRRNEPPRRGIKARRAPISREEWLEKRRRQLQDRMRRRRARDSDKKLL